MLQKKPRWYGELASVLSSAGVLAALPASPVYPEEAFTMNRTTHYEPNDFFAVPASPIYLQEAFTVIRLIVIRLID